MCLDALASGLEALNIRNSDFGGTDAFAFYLM